MPSIAKIHEKILDHLVKRRKSDPDLFFMPRKINNDGRMDKGYWFLGNEDYVYVSLWSGVDWKERVNCIGFVVLPDRSCYIELSGQGAEETVPFLEKVAELESGIDRPGVKYKWFKMFPGKDNDQYLEHFEYYIKKFKPKVDKLLDSEKPPVIHKVTPEEFQKYGMKVIALRNKQIVFAKTNKITRLSWNTNNWQYPSGWLGKSDDINTHEGKYGFGYEEWLFDRSRLINGFHYGFIRGFQSKKEKHAKKAYNVHLYTQNDLRQYFYIGCISNCEGITKAESTATFKFYKENGWINEMAITLERVEADVAEFNRSKPDLFFNVRFRLSDIIQDKEPEELAYDDDNVTTDRFKLLGYRGEVVPAMIPIEPDEEDEGKFKNTEKRKRTFNMDQEYDPYHDRMQNAIVAHLRADEKYDYKHVYIEKSRVDIKAVKHDGNWDYFEIKTDSPKRSIRNAIGQVMEYAYYPGVERAQNIIVVGDREPDGDSIVYLDYLRNRFDIPITYRFFDWDRLVLSDDF